MPGGARSVCAMALSPSSLSPFLLVTFCFGWSHKTCERNTVEEDGRKEERGGEKGENVRSNEVSQYGSNHIFLFSTSFPFFFPFRRVRKEAHALLMNRGRTPSATATSGSIGSTSSSHTTDVSMSSADGSEPNLGSRSRNRSKGKKHRAVNAASPASAAAADSEGSVVDRSLFAIEDDGEVVVDATGQNPNARESQLLKRLQDLISRGQDCPLATRSAEVLSDRVRILNAAFEKVAGNQALTH